jgi:hypothetical protein
MDRRRWPADRQLHVDAFVTVNFAFMAADIFLAHSVNRFEHPEEYIPLWFSVVAPPILVVCLVLRDRMNLTSVWNDVGQLVGWIAIVIGLAGVILHLHSQFFYEKTLKSLTYAAPFAAPLAYTGLGLLLVMNRMVSSDTAEWAQWIILLSLGGFAGDFVLSLTDHAVNGFYRPEEWIPVISAAFAVSFLLAPFLVPVTRRYLWLCALVVLLQAAVGIAGFFFHVAADLERAGRHSSFADIFQSTINAAPPMAPLLFPNLSLLALYALWAYSRFVPEAASLPPTRHRGSSMSA